MISGTKVIAHANCCRGKHFQIIANVNSLAKARLDFFDDAFDKAVITRLNEKGELITPETTQDIA
ncbi:hypothetical protein D3C87_1703230 [compost metagenome]